MNKIKFTIRGLEYTGMVYEKDYLSGYAVCSCCRNQNVGYIIIHDVIACEPMCGLCVSKGAFWRVTPEMLKDCIENRKNKIINELVEVVDVIDSDVLSIVRKYL